MAISEKSEEIVHTVSSSSTTYSNSAPPSLSVSESVIEYLQAALAGFVHQLRPCQACSLPTECNRNRMCDKTEERTPLPFIRCPDPSTNKISGHFRRRWRNPNQNKDQCSDSHYKYSNFYRPRRLDSLLISSHLTLALIITAIFACVPSSLGSLSTSTASHEETERLVCMEGVSPPLPGATFPRGDIFLKVGDTLEVFCKLNLTNPAAKGYNASNIDFVFTKSHIRREDVFIRAVNDSTAVVRVKHMNASNPFLQCVLRRPDGSPIQVCQNQIDVGYPPLPVEDFRCVAKGWKSLNCTWKLPLNPVPTKYTLTKLWSRYHTSTIPCPNTTATPTSCTWDGRMELHYRSNTDPLNFRLNGTNALMPSGISWDYSFSLGSIVIPEKPRLFITKKSPIDYMLNWTFPEYEYYKYGLEHQLKICCEYEEKCNVTEYQTKPVEGKMAFYYIRNVTLPHANGNYTITIRLRSPNANRTEEFWSESEIKSVLTQARAPDFPPETDVGSFENVIKNKLRDVYIYWKSIPKELRNAPKFAYDIAVFENKRELKMKPAAISDSYAKFPNLSMEKMYHFYITALNAKGKSENSSEITVPSFGNLPEEPKSVSKIDYTNGSFEISWRRPPWNNNKDKEILSFTIFRCRSKKPRPYPCEGRLEWDKVDATKSEPMRKFYDNLPHHSDHIYQFAVSANTDKYASGMVWATCTLIHDKVPGKLRSVRVENPGEDEILIKWDLECSYQSGDIEGFKITYCQVEKYPAVERCKDGSSVVKEAAVEGANMTSYRLVKLKPYSYYKIYVSILAAAGQSQRSDPIFARTSEGAPSLATISGVSQLSNVSATLHIESPSEWNGLLREYKIYYRAEGESGEQERRVPLHVSNETKSFSEQVTLRNLTSNSNYTAFVVSCTTKCSARSEPFSFMTDIGHTDLTTFPRISCVDGNMELEWDRPGRLGGPIEQFQVMLKRNGEPVTDASDYPTVDYSESAKTFYAEVPQTCEPSTNFTAQVRAVSRLENGLYLYGAWSPPANFSCGGGTSWLIWVILAIVAIVGAAFFAYLSNRFYHYFRRMKEGLTIKLPPGLNSELNGFAHKPPPRGRSNDQSYGKETYAYPLQPTSTQMDESNNFLSSSELNQGEAEESLIEKPFCPSPANPLLGGREFSSTRDGSCMDDDGNDIRLTEFSIHKDPCSSPTYKKLGIMGNGSVVPMPMEPVPGPSSRTPSLNSDGEDLSSASQSTINQNHISNHLPISNPSPLRAEPPTLPNGISRRVPDVLNSSPSSPTSLNSNSTSPTTRVAGSPPPIQSPPPPPASSSSYVKWTTLVPDMKTGDAGGAIDNSSRQAAYCQVGILLDS